MLSVEFAHLLGNESLDTYHWESWQFFKDKLALNSQGFVLIDDYNFKHDERMLPFSEIKIFKESDCVRFMPALLKKLELVDKKNICYEGIFLKRNHRWTCAALTAGWYLARLGEVSSELSPGEILINILPEKFIESEKKALFLVKIFLNNPPPIINYYWRGEN